MSREHDAVTPDERERLDRLPRELPPPAELEDRVVAAIDRAGLLGRAARSGPESRFSAVSRFRYVRMLAAAVVAGVALGGSFLAGRRTAAPLPGTEPGFLLALYEGPEFESFSDDNAPTRFEDYNRWIAGLRARGQFVTGLPLDSTGYVLTPADGEATLESRFPDSRDGWVDGLFVIRASDYDEALRIARSAPHLRYRGRISIRRISPI